MGKDYAKKAQHPRTNGDRATTGLSDDDIKAHLRFMTERIDTSVAQSRAANEGIEKLQASLLELERNDQQKTVLLETLTKELQQSNETQTLLMRVLLKTVDVLDGGQKTNNDVSLRKRKAMQAEIMEVLRQTNNTGDGFTVPTMEIRAREPIESKVSAANWNIEDILLDYFKEGSLYDMKDPTCLTSLCCPVPISKEKAKFKYCMELLSLCFTKDHWNMIVGNYQDPEEEEEEDAVVVDLDKVTETIKQVCAVAKDYMLRLELECGARDKIIAREQGKRVKMTVTGLGERYRKWKVKVGDATVEETRIAKLQENGFVMGSHGRKRQRQRQEPTVQEELAGNETD